MADRGHGRSGTTFAEPERVPAAVTAEAEHKGGLLNLFNRLPLPLRVVTVAGTAGLALFGGKAMISGGSPEAAAEAPPATAAPGALAPTIGATALPSQTETRASGSGGGSGFNCAKVQWTGAAGGNVEITLRDASGNVVDGGYIGVIGDGTSVLVPGGRVVVAKKNGPFVAFGAGSPPSGFTDPEGDGTFTASHALEDQVLAYGASALDPDPACRGTVPVTP